MRRRVGLEGYERWLGRVQGIVHYLGLERHRQCAGCGVVGFRPQGAHVPLLHGSLCLLKLEGEFVDDISKRGLALLGGCEMGRV